MAAGDLTTLAAVKAHLGITDTTDDALLQTYITAASRRFELEVGQAITQTTYTDTFDGADGTTKTLRFGPVLSVTSVSVDGSTISAATGTDDGFVVVGDQVRLRGFSFSRGVANCAIAYSAGYATTPAEVDFAVLELVAWWYRGKEHIGIASTTVAGAATSYQGTYSSEQGRDGVPASFMAVASLYHRRGV